jgi:seryl-tRNA synthetase
MVVDFSRELLQGNSNITHFQSQVYSIENHPLCLTGTAEIPLASMYTNQIIPIEKLPLKFVAFGHCFRLEVGRRGSEVRGLYRVVTFTSLF